MINIDILIFYGFLFSISSIIVLLIGIYLKRKEEIKNFNKGFCPHCGYKLKKTPQYSSNNPFRLWCCTNQYDICGYTTFISYNIDKTELLYLLYKW